MTNIRENTIKYNNSRRADSIREGAIQKADKLASMRPVALQQPLLSSRPIFGAVYNQEAKFLSVEHLAERLNAYFDKMELRGKKPTVVSMALELGYSSKAKLLTELRSDSNFANNLEAAVTYIESMRNEELLEPGASTSGIIFDLKNNHNWAEKSEQKVEQATDTLALLVQSLQGKVLRPRILVEEGEFTEYRAEDVI